MVGDFDGLFEDGEETVDAIARRIIIVVGFARGAITAVFGVSLTSVHVLLYDIGLLGCIGFGGAGVLVCDERKVEKAERRAQSYVVAGFVTGAGGGEE